MLKPTSYCLKRAEQHLTERLTQLAEKNGDIRMPLSLKTKGNIVFSRPLKLEVSVRYWTTASSAQSDHKKRQVRPLICRSFICHISPSQFNFFYLVFFSLFFSFFVINQEATCGFKCIGWLNILKRYVIFNSHFLVKYVFTRKRCITKQNLKN